MKGDCLAWEGRRRGSVGSFYGKFLGCAGGFPLGDGGILRLRSPEVPFPFPSLSIVYSFLSLSLKMLSPRAVETTLNIL